MNNLIGLAYLFITCGVFAQSYAPAPGQLGSTAIHKDSSVIMSWGTNLTISRGYANNSFPGSGYVTYGEIADAIGPADGISVVSLGDGGVALYEFAQGIQNGPGPDFAIFENGFTDDYMELAFVEVSSDGVYFSRFPAVSETPSVVQLDNFSFSDCRYVHNLAGKYRAEYGTPFDLDELNDSLIDLSDIHWVRIIDVVGSIDSLYGTFDIQGNIINDPWPTEFESGGFDLDALAVINEVPLLLEENSLRYSVFPNPFGSMLNINCPGKFKFSITDVHGQLLKAGEGENNVSLLSLNFETGIYFVIFEQAGHRSVSKMIKE